MTHKNMVTVDQTSLVEVLKASHTLGQPLFIWGSPGIGKSDIVNRFATDIGGVVCDIRLGQYDAVDIRGLPDVEGSTTVWHPPSTLPFKGSDWPTDRPIILFLDEAMQAAPAVQGVAFQLVLDRAVGEHELLDNVYVCAASNRETDRAGVNRMLSPLANRFLHVDLSPTLDGWKGWAFDAGVAPEVIAYLSTRPDMLDMFEKAQKAGAKSFATPRSWEYVSRILSEFRTETNLLDIMVPAAIGPAVAVEFLQFYRMTHALPTMEEVIEDPEGTTVPVQNDERYAVITMLAARVPEDDQPAIGKIIQYVRRYDQQYQMLFTTSLQHRSKLATVGSADLMRLRSDLHDIIMGDD